MLHCHRFLLCTQKDGRKALQRRILKNTASYLIFGSVSDDESTDGIITFEKPELVILANTDDTCYSTSSQYEPLFPIGDFQISTTYTAPVLDSATVPELTQTAAKIVFLTICKMLKDKLFHLLPELLNLIDESLSAIDSKPTEAIQFLRVLDILCRRCDSQVCVPVLWKLFARKLVVDIVGHKLKIVRFEASKAISSLIKSNRSFDEVRALLVDSLLHRLGDIGSNHGVEGAIEALYHIMEKFSQEDIVAYCDILLIPILKASRNRNSQISCLAGRCLASLVSLYPLNRDKGNVFVLDLLLKPKEIPDRAISASVVNAELRDYQRAGVNWLFLLRDHNLNGILCDDMGLGKTLQAICVMVSTHDEIEGPKQSLIVSPNSVTHHWFGEIEKYVKRIDGSPTASVIYHGKPCFRQQLQEKIRDLSIEFIIVSYETLRTDSEFFQTISYKYLILDEGHVIRSSKSLISQVIQGLNAEHRLILSGTPVQNSVTDLWCLFSFLMPGYLGNERQFNKQFSRSIAASKKSGGIQQSEEAVLALSNLQKQVLPFMLRRMKQDVVKSLPPKIIQDVYCEMADIQREMYQHYVEQNQALLSSLDDSSKDYCADGHVFKELYQLRKLCNHPALFNASTNFKSMPIEQSGKLMALLNLLRECGLDSEGNCQHKVLIFCQMRDMIQLVVSQVLPLLCSVKYLVMHGGVSAVDRAVAVKHFNDPAKDYNVLVLTTQIGGVGLNLTAADTVIFVEHDWNPSKDHQAMDRAHRIGQRRTVNVYRLLTKDTIEDKIMNIQRFKTAISQTLVDQVPLDLSTTSEQDTNEPRKPVLDLLASSSQPSELLKSAAAKTTATKSITESHDQRMHLLAERKLQDYADEFDPEKIASAAKKRKGNPPNQE